MNLQGNHIHVPRKEGYFFSPRPDHRVNNTYINSFYQHLGQRVQVLNRQDKVMGRSTELMKHALKTKVLVLNWPEDIVHLRFGWFQAICFNLCVLLVKARGGRLIWVCHNKKSHAKGKTLLSAWNRKFFMSVADKIIVHAKEAASALAAVQEKVVFIPHPRYERKHQEIPQQVMQQQALIWGNLTPYKGLESFIRDYKKFGSDFPVKIIGRGKPDYVRLLQAKAAGTKIIIENTRLTEQELEEEFKKCSVIILPYKKTDTFSSGALIHSLNANKIILGPRIGNFLDLSETGACIAYHDGEELFGYLDRFYHDPLFYQAALAEAIANMDAYYRQNTWEHMIEQVVGSIHTPAAKDQLIGSIKVPQLNSQT